MSEIIELLRSAKCFRTIKSEASIDVNVIEEELGLVFSEDYKEYLHECGCVIIYGHEFTGIATDLRLSVVESTRFVRSLLQNFPQDFYVIECTNDYFYCQDSSGSVYLVSHSGYIRPAYENLYSFFVACIEESDE